MLWRVGGLPHVLDRRVHSPILATMPPNVDPLSVVSLHLEVLNGGSVVAIATGFVIVHEIQPFLITNWHVVTGRDADTGDPMPGRSFPDALRVSHHETGHLGRWRSRDERLFDQGGNPLWLEHPRGRPIDVAALPLLPADDTITYYPLDLALDDESVRVQVAMTVSIIGYPLGLTSAGMLPIWKTGHIASEPEIDHQDAPQFLVDAKTKPGMSGSPVVLRHYGPIGVQGQPGVSMRIQSGGTTRWLGVYSGRFVHRDPTQGDAELGRVWRPEAVRAILNRFVSARP